METCNHEEWHQDMYPEFAPEPIVIRCDSEAKVTIQVSGYGPYGLETWQMRLCGEHLSQLLAEQDDEWCHAKTVLV